MYLLKVVLKTSEVYCLVAGHYNTLYYGGLLCFLAIDGKRGTCCVVDHPTLFSLLFSLVVVLLTSCYSSVQHCMHA